MVHLDKGLPFPEARARTPQSRQRTGTSDDAGRFVGQQEVLQVGHIVSRSSRSTRQAQHIRVPEATVSVACATNFGDYLSD